jgi:hypothetical protein
MTYLDVFALHLDLSALGSLIPGINVYPSEELFNYETITKLGKSHLGQTLTVHWISNLQATKKP